MKFHQKLESVYETSSCTYDSDCQWVWSFQSGKEDLVDELQFGAPKTAMNKNTTMKKDDAYAKWIPHFLTGA